jgi:hypothetical protein
MTSHLTKADFTLGALYRLAAKRRMGRSEIESLMVLRAGVKPVVARALAGHWLTTEPFRRAAA